MTSFDCIGSASDTIEMNELKRDEWIPNIVVGQDYDRRYVDAVIHYDTLGNFADFFGNDMPVHRHANYLQIHAVDSGAVNFHIDDRTYAVEGPCIFQTPASVPHSFYLAESRGHVLTVHQSLIWRLAQRCHDSDLSCGFDEGICITHAELDDAQRQQWRMLEQLWDNLANEWHGTYAEKSIVLENLVESLLININRLNSNRTQAEHVKNADLITYNRFKSELEQHFAEHWRVSRYAREVGISEARLNQLCQKIAHTTPKKIIVERLLMEAKRLLAFSHLAVNEISYELGFDEPSALSRLFKKSTGLTPLGYRKRAGSSSAP